MLQRQKCCSIPWMNSIWRCDSDGRSVRSMQDCRSISALQLLHCSGSTVSHQQEPRISVSWPAHAVSSVQARAVEQSAAHGSWHFLIFSFSPQRGSDQQLVALLRCETDAAGETGDWRMERRIVIGRKRCSASWCLDLEGDTTFFLVVVGQ